MSVVVGLDANNLIHRAFHAAAGQASLALRLLDEQLARVERDVRPVGEISHVVVAVDDPVRSFRRDRYPAYKAGRPDKPASLVGLLDLFPRRLAAAGLPVVCPPGLEADDVLAQLTADALAAGLSCVVVSSDRDVLSLVSPGVVVLQPSSPPRLLDVAAVSAEYGMAGDGYRLLAALRGDPSDNLPGVAGVGAKRAVSLVSAFPSTSRLFDASPQELADALRMRSLTVAQRVLAARELVEFNLAMMSPWPVALDLPSYACRGLFGVLSGASTLASVSASAAPAGACPPFDITDPF